MAKKWTVAEALALPVEQVIQMDDQRVLFFTLDNVGEDDLESLKEDVALLLPKGVSAIFTNFPVAVKSLDLKKERLFTVSGNNINDNQTHQLQALLDECLPSHCKAIVTNFRLNVDTLTKFGSQKLLNEVVCLLRELSKPKVA